ncbi:MAG: FKBP-type peptidyl-prolyl cis-trans isomerase [Bacteroidales bacterium]
MKRILSITLVTVFTVSTVFAQGKKKKEEFQLKTKTDTISYIIGSDIGKNIKTNNISFAQEAFNLGVTMGYNGTDTLLTKEQIEKTMQAFQMEMQAKMESEKTIKSLENKEKGTSYLAENKKKEGVIELPDGLQYRILKEGTGNSPKETDTVTVYYKGTLIDGTVFDATTEGEPVSFPLNNLIKGWTEGIQLMKTGSKYEFVIPSNLGYGDREVGPIPAGSTLVFEVELVGIKPGQ